MSLLTIKAEKFEQVPEHKYISREGVPGSYKYEYAEDLQPTESKPEDKTEEDPVVPEKLEEEVAPKEEIEFKKPELAPEKSTNEEIAARLQVLGNALFNIQRAGGNLRDDQGFNNYDTGLWPTITIDPNNEASLDKVRLLLHKYRRQIISMVGESEFAELGTAEALKRKNERKEAGISSTPTFRTSTGDLHFPVKGFMGKKLFADFLAINRLFKDKHVGLSFDGDSKSWYVRSAYVKDFPFGEYKAALEKLGLVVDDLPEAPVAPAPTVAEALVALSTKEVIDQITRRRTRDTVAVMQVTEGPHAGHIGFWSTYSEKYNEIFSNKTDILSGIVEYVPELGHARVTNSIDLAEEAIGKIRELMPNFTLVIDASVTKAHEDYDLKLKADQKSIPEVEAKLAPEIQPFPFQNAGVRFLLSTDGNALIGDEMGLGKTYQTLAYAAAANRRMLVVCPKVVRRNWLNEAEKFFPKYFVGKELKTVVLKKEGMPDLTKVNLATINYENLEKFMPAIKAAGFDLLVVDESHRMKNPKAKLTQNIKNIAKDVSHKILLSGTAIKNKKSELYEQLELIKPGLFKSKYDLKMSTTGGTWHKLQTVYKARTKANVLKDLPPKITSIVEQKMLHLPDVPLEGMGIGDYSTVKHQLANAKAPYTVDFVKEMLDSSDSNVLVFTDSVEAADHISTSLGDVAVVHHASKTDLQRQEAVDHFNPATRKPDSKKRVFVATTASAGVGLNLQVADKVVFNDLPWTTAELRQAEDRAHRIGTKKAVNIYWLTAQDHEFDCKISDTLKRKYDLLKKHLEGKKLTAEERAWLDKPVSMADLNINSKFPSTLERPENKLSDGSTVEAPLTTSVAKSFASDFTSEVLQKSLVIRLYDLFKARVRGALGASRASAKYGALVSGDPSFYPQSGGIRYLMASENVGKILARYQSKGIAVEFIPPVLEVGKPQPVVAPESSTLKYEPEALITEYKDFIGKQVSIAARKYGLSADDKKELTSVAHLYLLETARGWNKPGEFKAYIFGSLPQQLKHEALRIKGITAKEIPSAQLPEEDGEALKQVPMVRVESPDMYVKRKELGESVSKIFTRVLNPVENAVVLSRLNILNPLNEGVYDQGNLQGVKPWNKVKEDVLESIPQMDLTVEQRAAAKLYLSELKEGRYTELFDIALNKLRSPNLGVTESEKHTISELASLHQLYLEGIRHTAWDVGESFGRLLVKPEKVDLKKLEKEYISLTQKVKDLPMGPEKDIVKKQKLALARQLLDLWGSAKKSLIVFDYQAAIDRLVSEYQLWQLNGY